MAINKIIYENTVLIDLTNDTVQADKLALGYTAHAANGELIIGTLENRAGQISLESNNFGGQTLVIGG